MAYSRNYKILEFLLVEIGSQIPIISGIPWAVLWIPKPRIPVSTKNLDNNLKWGEEVELLKSKFNGCQ